MYLPLLIARRLKLRMKGERGTATGMTVGVCGVALSLVIMIASVAIVTGFKSEIEARVAGINSDILLYNADGLISLPPGLRQAIGEALPGASVSLVADQTGMLKTASQYQALSFRGLPADYDTTFLSGVIERGALSKVLRWSGDGPVPVALSRVTAEALELDTCSRTDAFFVMDSQIAARRYEVAAIFDTHFGDYDRMTAFVPVMSLPGMVSVSEGTAIEIRGIAMDDLPQAVSDLYVAVLDAYTRGEIETMPVITDVRHTGELYLNWLALLDTNVVVILILMGVVAGFTLISSLFVIILRKVRLIGVLKALGATDRMIADIFVAVAMRIVLVGLVAGDIIALGLLWLQSRTHLIGLSPENYYLDYVPVNIDPVAVLLVNCGVAVMAFLVILLPSRLVMTISPASTMRYE